MGARVTVTDAAADRLTGAARRCGARSPGSPSRPRAPTWSSPAPAAADDPLLVAAAGAGIEVIGEVELAWRIGADAARAAGLARGHRHRRQDHHGRHAGVDPARPPALDAVACGNIGLPVIDAVLGGTGCSPSSCRATSCTGSPRCARRPPPCSTSPRTTSSGTARWPPTSRPRRRDLHRRRPGRVQRRRRRVRAARGRRAASGSASPSPRPGAGQYGVTGGWLVHGDLRARCRPPRSARPARTTSPTRSPPPRSPAPHGVPPEAVRAGLDAYQPPAHRVELVAEARRRALRQRLEGHQHPRRARLARRVRPRRVDRRRAAARRAGRRRWSPRSRRGCAGSSCSGAEQDAVRGRARATRAGCAGASGRLRETMSP